MEEAEQMVDSKSQELDNVVNMVEMDLPGNFYRSDLSLLENYERLAMHYRVGQ